ncbi:NAD(P)/FAD-dependent oxidoreductase [Chelativorans xinjiangense]|uniref:NAD(P)/FAD-dependent oxidoreductase n=1 Tax=Chelativorans xinjiangense TaxID=2681485 RepID=UPI001FE3F2A4|nr:FAD-binding oxidoreductase [Chelativorans xinjiangense]
MKTADIVVIGAGIVGAAIAFGLLGKGKKVMVLDGAPEDFRASRANFGLIWVQGKGEGIPSYQAITQQSASEWDEFARKVREIARLPLTMEQKGGLILCLGDKEWSARSAKNERLAAQQPGREPDTVMLERDELSRLLPGVRLGQEVVGASFGRTDGHVNPLELLTSLHVAIRRLGGAVSFGTPVLNVRPTSLGFEIVTDKETFAAEKVVLAAGLSTPGLAAPLGMRVPLKPQRGQILVTERMRPFLPFPASGLRQTGEGTVTIGATQEDVGLDISTTVSAASRLAARAVRIVPALEHATIVRQWSGLRIKSPDGAPIYDRSRRYPGAFVASCHSGVTLAAYHAHGVADAVIAGALDDHMSAFAPERFDVQKCA